MIFYKDRLGNEPIKEYLYARKKKGLKRRNLNDFLERSQQAGKTEYTTFNDVWNDKTFLNDEEKARIEFEVSLIGKLIEARESRGITQKDLA